MRKKGKGVLATVLALAMVFSLAGQSGISALAETVTEDDVISVAEPEAMEEAEAMEKAESMEEAEAIEECAETEPVEADISEADCDEEDFVGTEEPEEEPAETAESEDEYVEIEDTEEDPGEAEDSEDILIEDEDADIVEPEEENEESEDAELAYQTLNAQIDSIATYSSANSAGTTITLTGSMPEDATVTAVPVDVSIDGVEIIAAYDITIYDANGATYQPQEGPIRVRMESSAIRNAAADGDLSAYHMYDASAEPEKISATVTEDGAVEFDAASFSVYAVGIDSGIQLLADGESTLDILKGTARTVTKLSASLPAGEYKLVYHTLTGDYYHFTASGALTEIDSDDGIEFDFDYEYDNGHTLGSPSDMFTFTVPEGGTTVTIVWDDSEHYDIYDFAVVDASTGYYVNDNTGDIYTTDILYYFEDITTETVYDPLAGATFLFTKVVDNVTYYGIFDANGELTGWTQSKSEATTLTSGEDGYIHLSGLEDGTYYLIETTAPLGYDVLTDPVEVIVSGEGSQAEVNNDPNDYGYQWGEDKHTISGSKTWVDDNNAGNTRPETITINLHDATGTQIDSTTVTVGNTTSWSFTVPEVQNDDYSQYYVTENRVRGYETTVNGLDVTNTYTGGDELYNDDGELTVTKVWNDGDNEDELRPQTITVTLLADDGQAYDADGNEIDSVTLGGDGEWTYTFENLPMYNDDDQEIVYTVSEVEVTGYKTEIDYTTPGDFTITNTQLYTQTTEEPDPEDYNGELTVTKVWDDESNKNLNRPDSITVNLTDGENNISVTVDSGWDKEDADTWTYTFTDLVKYDENGAEIIYTITEDEVTGYDSVIAGFTVTNTAQMLGENGDGEITVTKEWYDDENHDHIRTTEVAFTLTGTIGSDDAAETVYGPEEIKISDDGEGNWVGTFDGLYTYYGGEEINYTLSEEVPEGYESYILPAENDGFRVINYHGDYTATITVTKEWVDDDDYSSTYRPDEITMHLYADGVEVQGEEVTLTAQNDWTAEIPDAMLVFEDEDENAVEISYTLKEENVPTGYESDQDSDVVIFTKDADGNYSGTVTITNTLQTIDTETPDPANPDVTGPITVSKEWNDGNDADGLRPDEVVVTVYSSNWQEDGSYVISKEVTLSEDDWSAEVSGLPKYTTSGDAITYKVSEDSVEGYKTSGGDLTQDEEGNWSAVFTNTLLINADDDDPTNDGVISIEKKWNDGDNANRPTSVIVSMDGGDYGYGLLLLESRGWSGSFTDLPAYDKNGEPIDYIIHEAYVEGYKSEMEGTLADGFTITNTLLVNGDDGDPENDGKISVTKEWKDNDNEYDTRPEEVTIALTADGGDTGISLILNEEGEWTGTFEDLAAYNEDGIEISYSISEADIEIGNADGDSYEAEIVENETKDGFIVTNTLTGKWGDEPGEPDNPSSDPVGVTVTKEWVDNDNQDETRPDNITFTLYANEVATDKTVALSEGNSWSGSFGVLDKYDENGKLIDYTISEEDVDDYASKVDGSVEEGFTVTNILQITDWTVEKVLINKEDDATGKDGAYTVGDTAEFMITVTNTGNLAVDQIVVTETLEGAVFKDSEDGSYTLNEEKTVATITNLATGEDGIVYLYAEYTIEEKDLGVDLSNSVTTSANPEGDPSGPDGRVDIPTEEENPHLSVTKEATSKPLNGYAYDVNEVITYKITVTNDGNVTISDFAVSDDLTGETWQVDSLAPGESQEFTTSYTVQESDIKNGSVVNNATVTGGEDSNGKEPDTTPGTDEQPVMEPNPSMYVRKTANVDEGYKADLGDEITYTIEVINNGNETLTDITVTDEMTGDEWTITELKPGETWTGTTKSYTVTEEDILNGSIANVAVAEAENPNYDPGDPGDPENPEDVENDGEADVPTVDKDPHITITKETTSEGSSRGEYTEGDTIEYEITVTNDGNLTISGITVADELTGDEWEIEEPLAPGESKTFEASYEVTADDVANGKVINEATLTGGTSPDEENPNDVPSEPGINEAPTYSMFYPMDEEIVPNNDDEANPGSWIDRESVNEYDAIEIEMSTTLPRVSGETLTESDYTITFHNQLVSQLVLDELDSDFTVDINGTPIDHQYYEIDLIQTNSLIQLFSISDGCTFHVNVDLSKLYNDGVISEDDLGTGTIRLFFYADLETTDVNGSYTSTAWYHVAADGEVVYTSEASVVTVYTFEIIVDAIDKDTGAPLAGAQYGLYYDEECTNPVSRNGEAYVVTTDENGQAMFVGIAEGIYYVKELVKPEDYASITEPMVVTLEGSEDSNHIFEVIFPYSLKGDEPDDPKDPEKTANVDAGASVEVGDEITYTISYYNNINIAAIVTITDTLAEGVDYVSSDPAGEYDADTHTVVWTLDAEAFEEGSVELTVQVNEKAAGSELDNTAGVQIGNAATVETNTVGIPVEPEDTSGPDEPRTPEKSANVQVGAEIAVGDEVTYTITYYNNYDVPTDVIIVDTLDDGLDFVSATDGGIYDENTHTVTWTISDADALSEGSVTLTLMVNENAATEGAIANTASVKVGDEAAAETNTVGISVKDQNDGGTGGTGGNGGNGGGTGGTGSNENPTGTVKTADTNAPILYLFMIMFAGAAIVTLSVRRRTVRR